MGLSQTPARAADEYDTLRQRWAGLLVGTGYDPAVEPFATQLANQAQIAGQYRTAMAPTGTTALWPDLPLGSVSANVTASYRRLNVLTLAWAMPGTALTGDPGLLADIRTGLDYLGAHAYTAGGTSYNNWWDWQIGTPQTLLGILCVLADQLSGAQIATWLAAVDHYIPDSRYDSYSGTSTGANRVDLCMSTALRGILGRDAAKVALARDALSPVFPYVTAGDGFYRDGSFIQHTVIPYAGAYGAVLINALAELLSLLAGSTWAVTDPNRQIFLDTVERSYAPFLFNGLVMDGVTGRGISRGIATLDPLRIQGDDHRRGHSVINGILVLADAASPAERARWRGLAKGWYQRDYWSPPLADLTLAVPALARAKAVLDDTSVSPIAEPVGSRIFGGMDRVTHRRPGWALAISMCSTRTSFYEHGNGENVRGWHTSNGMVYTWGATTGNGQFSDAFWPTVDPYRLPGTTVSRKPLPDAAGPAWGGLMPTARWAGGATDGEYAVVGQSCQGAQSTLQAKKSWICLDDTVICLGAGITSTDGYAVESIVDNRNLGSGTGTQAFLVNGTAQLTTVGSSGTFTATSWAHNPFAGYVFPGGATIKGVREDRTGAWHDINVNGATTALSRKYLTLWVDHGTNPTNGSYAYQLMPVATSAATQARAADPGWMTILNNTRYQQAVQIPSKGVTAINYWSVPLGPIGGVMVDQPCAVLVRVTGNQATVCLADPQQNVGEVTLTWNRAVSAVTSRDSTVTVVSTGASLVLKVTTAGSAGATHKATVTLS
ncbi:polysaccharide lyase 8 family protein [Longispora fulva]|uniref:Hyaluronate lyase n=1 Tax=Longispora fulva TaxID=619741 RepID=A0A8J7GPC1_9ACTN|nr:polysaccharide lyase 8 family protein [Longispora fulva]MBG6134356.1 hyaluronate lyase [Longispora fulva]